MIDIPVEEFTAKEAFDLGLANAIKRKEAKVEGSYSLTPDGFIEFNQKNFLFKDNMGGIRCGKFVDDQELCDFWEMYGEFHKRW